MEMEMEMVMRFPIFILFFQTIVLVPLIQSSDGLSGVELETQALLNWRTSLKNQTLDSWVFTTNNKTSHCGWFGIQCSNGGSVIEISLSNSNLEGTLGRLNFSLLPQLVHLDLSWNSLEGTIPPDIGSLLNLTFLDLSHNELSGSIPNTFFSGLRKLQILNLTRNHIGGQIPTSLVNLTKLHDLRLGYNSFTGPIPEQLGFVFSLQILELYENPLLVGPIPGSLGQLQKLQRLDISSCNLSSNIPPQIGDMKELIEISLSMNLLYGPIPPSIGTNSQELFLLRLETWDR